MEFSPIELNLDDYTDCEYTGGVNFQLPYSEDESDSPSDGEMSESESLCELEGEELENNLQKLRIVPDGWSEFSQPGASAFDMMVKAPKTAAEWKRAEENRALGYNGQLRKCHPPDDKSTGCHDVTIHAKTTFTHRDLVAATVTLAQCKPEAELFLGYLSDESDDDFVESDESDNEDDSDLPAGGSAGGSRVPRQRHARKEKKKNNWKQALDDIDELLKSKKTKFVGGPDGLQGRRAHAIQCHLALVVKNGRLTIDASKRDAEACGFAAGWGGRQLCSWSKLWVTERKLPTSMKGRHAKVYMLLGDPTITTELRAYVRSNKWAINPEMLAKFMKNELIPEEAKKYLNNIVNDEMPCGLKQYMELKLFPRIHLKVGRGISLSTASNDAVDRYLVLDDEFRLWKKGAGRRIHRSDVICLTSGHMADAGQSIEYGKNHDGYWTGEMFVKQLIEKIIPTFEQLHGAGYRALFLINNSQGHSAYVEDALITSCMHVNPAGKQARMQHGWFIKIGTQVEQSMVFPPNDPEHPNEPKGIKAVLTERVKKYLCDNCDCTFETLKKNLPKALESVQLKTIRL
ncbi:hypothetical protein BV22DRAFT_1108019 [Leucogyrophana mollusca]|uniref:Uncharacterized protein n=1 Tax=Leucogyrophana mollusca TaxID=85980 RepID=A0ACB8B1M1_9AGAM|nr:hypothetical protein BV22DRAFT_1108019 [Leucogyrophana mollusca]